uniref:RING-type E3 ubiquitin transferase n=1 Tax=Kalanchoe fedtschenkoi TaxID=63787 RepID=A0A7N0R9K1_KALFE
MGLPDVASDPPSHLYPQAIQLKLYQAFIFSIPVLFSIILFLLFYLFYLKRRSLAAASASASPSLGLPRSTAAHSSNLDSHSLCENGLLKEKLKEMLPKISFTEDLQAEDTICCVCLGEFEVAEELIQIPLCKHIFHLDCIHHWLFSHSTCPLCRCSVYRPVAATKLGAVTAPSSSWQTLYVAGPEHSDQVVLALDNLRSHQEHVIEVSDSSDRVANLDTTDTSPR